jgi:Carboxypeptidase regulatory-like domain
MENQPVRRDKLGSCIRIVLVGANGVLIAAASAQVGTPRMASSPRDVYPQISLKNQSREQAVDQALERMAADHHADWKTPIAFYGRVLDENFAPVSGATVHFGWTDLSKTGSSEKSTFTDAGGNFSLEGVAGKRLVVSVKKDGYYVPQDSVKNFEYGNPGEEIYHEPDAAQPVVFYLRTKHAGEALVKNTLDVVIPPEHGVAKVDLRSGKVSPNGELEISVSKPWPPKPVLPRYDWGLQITLRDGGFLSTDEEFAVEAPASGYTESIRDEMRTGRSDWNVTIERKLYFNIGNPPKYGVLTLRTRANSQHVDITYVLNPSGSRNLEDNAAMKR